MLEKGDLLRLILQFGKGEQSDEEFASASLESLVQAVSRNFIDFSPKFLGILAGISQWSSLKFPRRDLTLAIAASGTTSTAAHQSTPRITSL